MGAIYAPGLRSIGDRAPRRSHRQGALARPKQRQLFSDGLPSGNSGSIAIERERADTLGNVDRGIVAMLSLHEQSTGP